MPENAHTPVIFLTFANDPVGEKAYLRNLPEERCGIFDILDRAQKAGLCEVVVKSNVIIDEIFDVFGDERYRDRIAVFHYAGHADSFRLLLETAEGRRTYAHKDGLVPFLAAQKGLTLVFLNGCCTGKQSRELVQAGILAVIGTFREIDDTVAAALAVRFYGGIAAGLTLEKAWQAAETFVLAPKDDTGRSFRRVNIEGK
ncbi:MAG: CHAT domain-containing protein, partial [bacterium]|nr:CHAT domain-containing protein [bacterium]